MDIDKKITSYDTPWEDYLGSRVEEFIKEKLQSKYGRIEVTQSKQEDGLFHIFCFESDATYAKWLSDPITYADLLLKDSPIPIREEKGVSYSARLTIDREVAGMVIIEPDYTVGLRFCGLLSDGDSVVNAGINATLTVQRSTNNGASWQTVGTHMLPSRDASSTAFDAVNIGQYAVNGNQQLRMRASFNVLDDRGGIVASAQSAWVTANLTFTQLSVEVADDITQAVEAASQTGLPVSLRLRGSVARTLHVEVSGGKQTVTRTFAIGAGEYTSLVDIFNGYIQNTSTNGVLDHGVRTIKAWLTCSDGVTEDAYSSNTVEYMRMVYNPNTPGADLTTPRLLIKNVLTNVVNYEQSQLFSYAVWTPAAGQKVPLVIAVGNYNGKTEYVRVEQDAVMGEEVPMYMSVEIENDVDDALDAYLRITSNGVNMLAGSYIHINVDNSLKFSPVSGAVFRLDPKTRSNAESNPQRIINAASGAAVSSSWSGFGMDGTDGWIQDEEGRRCLRVPAGRKLTINFDWLAAFHGNPKANVTFEMMYRVRNVTNETDVIFSAVEAYNSSFLGMNIRPMNGVIKTVNQTSDEYQDFQTEEDAMVHLMVNCLNELVTSPTDASAQRLTACRVFLNGVSSRSFLYSNNTDEWTKGGTNKMVIGQDGADIDIYDIRVYNAAISEPQVRQNYASMLPTSEEKTTFRNENDIVTDGLIDVEKVKAQSKNVLIWHGTLPSINHSPENGTPGWWEIHKYNEDGTEDLEHSGTICKGSYGQDGCLMATRQGSTANTYWDSNLQTKQKDVTAKIKVRTADVHRSVSLEGIERFIEGGEEYVMLTDGWIDGNGIYRGTSYIIADGVPACQKEVGKINYASCMQSHLMGACRLYNDLHRAIVGNENSIRQGTDCRVAKYQDKFFFFNQADDSSPVLFTGGITFGAGKMDDMTWGYDKNNPAHADFCMIEGSDNNKFLTDCRVPWDADRISYDVKDGEAEGYIYDGEVSIDLDKFLSRKVDGIKIPTASIEANIAAFVNFFYRHNVKINYFFGTYEDFIVSDTAKNDHATQYWCTSGDRAYQLLRWNPRTVGTGQDKKDVGEWVNAGWDESKTGDARMTVVQLDQLYPTVVSSMRGNYEGQNRGFIRVIAESAKHEFGQMCDVDSFLLSYCYIITFECGSDNCSKNTYFVYDPIKKKWEAHADDVDTIKPIDNSGFPNKPYYITRIYPCKDGSTTPLFQGMGNAIFNLIEAMYFDGGEIRDMMKRMFQEMARLVKPTDKLPWISDAQKQTPWGCQWKYFFSTQKFFPAVAYNEQARIRYEYPESKGFVSERQVRPITQSIGDLLMGEVQFMKRRMILLASYAEYGEFGGNNAGSVGIADLTDTLGLPSVSTPTGTDAQLRFVGLVPHQYIYPCGRLGQTPVPMRQRCAPGKAVNFTLGSVSGADDVACSLVASNYYRSFGNMGDFSIQKDFNVNAKRLVSFVANPSDQGSPNFRMSKIDFNTPLIESINLKGCSKLTTPLSLASLSRLRSLNTQGTYLSEVTFPVSRLFTKAELGSVMTRVVVDGQPNLATLTLEAYTRMTYMAISGASRLNSYALLSAIYASGAKCAVKMEGINWKDVPAGTVQWLAANKSDIKGTITIAGDVTYAQKRDICQWFGDVDTNDPATGLRLVYPVRAINSISLMGGEDLTRVGATCQLFLEASPTSGNNIKTIRYESNAPTMATVSSSGLVTCKQVGNNETKPTVTITATAELLTGASLTASITLNLYKRIPEVGDFAWHDGTFGKEARNDKTLVGLVVRRCRDNDNPNKYQLTILAKEDVWFRTTDGTLNTNYMPWGLFRDNNGTNGFPTAVGTAIVESTALVTNAWDLPLGNYSNHSGSPMTAANYCDDLAGEYGQTATGYDLGTGYKATTANMNNDFNSAANTDIIMRHSDAILENYLKLPIPQTINELCDQMQKYIADSGNGGKSRQFWYPAARGCRLYEPVTQPGERLNTQYAKGLWHLPSAGTLMRIYNFFRVSRGGGNSGSVSAAYANESPATEAQLPIFSNVLKRYSDKGLGSPFVNMPQDNTWTSTESNETSAASLSFSNGSVNGNYSDKYNSYVVRAVAHFTFTL